MIDWRRQTLEIMKSLGIRPSKMRGQNFLIRPTVVKKMIANANISSEDEILEIGGGLGILTDGLVKTGNSLTVIEKEKALANYLTTQFPTAKVIHDDALKVDWPENNQIISNLPYSISTPLLSKMFHGNFAGGVIMLQKEVAMRCIVKPGDSNYSRLSILTNLHSKAKILFDVLPESFYPVPKVNSSVVKFEPFKPDLKNTHADIELLARNLFSLRRRTLRSVVRGFLKRKVEVQIWDKLVYNELRILELDIYQLDEICTFFKEENCWPLA